MGMTPDPGVAEVMRLLTAAEAVAAVGAELARRLEGAAIPPAIADRLTPVVALATPHLDATPPPQQRAMLGAIRALLRQAHELVAAPTRAPGWSHEDPALLDEQGRISGPFGAILAAALARLGPPADRPRAVLDVGVGAGWLALGLAAALPDATVVGIDIWPPALARARANVAAAGLGERVELALRDVADLDDRERFDLVWLPAPFLPAAILERALARARAALRPGGVLCFGLFGTADEPLARAVGALRTARAGGEPWTPAQAVALVERAGLRDVHEVERTWALPLRLVAGVR